MATVLLDQQIEIPTIGDLADFRQWALSEEFPQQGRIDYVTGKIEVDMSPEDLLIRLQRELLLVHVLSHADAEDIAEGFEVDSRLVAGC